MDNTSWLLGDGKNINFWNDEWCGAPLSSQLNIPDHVSQRLSASVSDFIYNGSWCIPPQLALAFPNLIPIVSQITIPLTFSIDKLLWKHSDNGDLQLKEAYLFKMQQFQDLSWANLIWSTDIPPSKSLLVWRIMQEKVPTDENLLCRGCHIPSMCNLCNNHVESSFHIFFECEFAIKLWSWLAGSLNQTIQFTCMEDMWKLCDNHWSPQCKITITAAIINLLNTIWYARNQSRFRDNKISWMNAISLISSSTTMTGNNTKKVSSNSIRDFSFLKFFNITIHNPKVPCLKEVIWIPPSLNWIKCNTDGASCGNPGLASCGGVFRDHNAEFLLAFAEPLGIASSYIAELNGAIKVIEIAFDNQWNNLWLETDSMLVVNAFKNQDNCVAWPLRNRWKNALTKTRQMNFLVSHVYREGNKVADLVANFGLNAAFSTSWLLAPSFIRDCLLHNKLGLPNFRLVSS
jgi:ribonuclease HI